MIFYSEKRFVFEKNVCITTVHFKGNRKNQGGKHCFYGSSNLKKKSESMYFNDRKKEMSMLKKSLYIVL